MMCKRDDVGNWQIYADIFYEIVARSITESTSALRTDDGQGREAANPFEWTTKRTCRARSGSTTL